MLKKVLEKRIEGLLEERSELRLKVIGYDKLEEKAESLTKVLSRLEGAESAIVSTLKDQIRELTLRLDILTMSPEEIETMRQIKVEGRRDDPLERRGQDTMERAMRRRVID